MTTTNQDPLRAHLERLLNSRKHPKSICPSEAARAMSPAQLVDAHAAHWRELMGAVRTILFEMRAAGTVEILQRGQVLPLTVGADEVKGPIRARLAMVVVVDSLQTTTT